MIVDKSRAQRWEREAKALTKKKKRHGGTLTSKDAAKLTRVNGRIIKRLNEDDDDGYQD